MENKNKKILITTGIFPPDSGGPASYCQLLLNELPKRGLDVRLITYADDLREADNVIKISRKQILLKRYFKYLKAVINNLSWSDVVYVQGPISEGLPSYLACKLKRKKYILKIVGDYAWEQGKQRFGIKEKLDDFQNKKYGVKVELMRFLQRLVAKNAQVIITPSQYLKNIIQKWGISGDKIKVIYNAASMPEINKNKNRAKNDLGLDKDIILSASRLVPWKGFGTLIEIMPKLLEVNQNFTLLIAGEGPDYGHLLEKIKELKLEKNVELLGRVERKILFRYMAAGEMFVLNTAYEGLSHLIIEAMSSNLPVITTEAGGNVELIENNKTGILIEYDNKEELISAILKLWQDKNLSEVLAKNAKEKVEKFFNKEIMINKLIRLLNV